MPTPNPLADNQATYILESQPDPLVGTEKLLIRPNASHVQLLYLSFTLVTDVNVANRLVWISLQNNAHHHPLGSTHSPHVASATWRHICSNSNIINMAGATIFRNIPLPTLRSTFLADTFHINVDNIQVGDQISAVLLQWKIWRGLT